MEELSDQKKQIWNPGKLNLDQAPNVEDYIPKPAGKK
jgi:hypothetical protein